MTIAISGAGGCAVSNIAKQCSVLIVNPRDEASPHRAGLETFGFRVIEVGEWPDDDRAVLEYHVVIVRLRNINTAPMLAMRLRAKPRFGQRVLIGLITGSTTAQDRVSALTSGFDDVLADGCDSRQLAARILRRLRFRPEYRCFLPSSDKRPSAA